MITSSMVVDIDSACRLDPGNIPNAIKWYLFLPR